MYLFLSPGDSKQAHPNNTPDDFIIDLNKCLKLDGVEWECALTELYYGGAKAQPMYIFSDICTSSYVHDRDLPVLRGQFDNPYYIPLSREFISTIRIYIRDMQLENYH